MLSFPFKSKCFFFHSTPHCKKMQIPTSLRGAPCGRKDISALSTPKGICVARHPYSNRAHRRRWSALKNLPRWKRWERDQLAVRPLLFGRSKRCRRGPLHFLFCHLLSEDKCTSLTLELRMGAKKKKSVFTHLVNHMSPKAQISRWDCWTYILHKNLDRSGFKNITGRNKTCLDLPVQRAESVSFTSSYFFYFRFFYRRLVNCSRNVHIMESPPCVSLKVAGQFPGVSVMTARRRRGVLPRT